MDRAHYQFRLVDLFVLAAFVSVGLAIFTQFHPLFSIPLLVWLTIVFIRYQTKVWRQLKIDRALNWQMEIFLLLEAAVQALLFLILLSPVMIILIVLWRLLEIMAGVT